MGLVGRDRGARRRFVRCTVQARPDDLVRRPALVPGRNPRRPRFSARRGARRIGHRRDRKHGARLHGAGPARDRGLRRHRGHSDDPALRIVRQPRHRKGLMRTGHFNESYASLVALSDSRAVWLWTAALALALLALPLAVGNYTLSLAVMMLVAVVGAVGLNLLTGMTGL